MKIFHFIKIDNTIIEYFIDHNMYIKVMEIFIIFVNSNNPLKNILLFIIH